MDIVVREIDPQAMTMLAAITLGIVAVVRMAAGVAADRLPAVSLVAGLGVAASYALLPAAVWGVVEAGVIIGLGASGMWSGVGTVQRATAKKGRVR